MGRFVSWELVRTYDDSMLKTDSSCRLTTFRRSVNEILYDENWDFALLSRICTFMPPVYFYSYTPPGRQLSLCFCLSVFYFSSCYFLMVICFRFYKRSNMLSYHLPDFVSVNFFHSGKTNKNFIKGFALSLLFIFSALAFEVWRMFSLISRSTGLKYEFWCVLWQIMQTFVSWHIIFTCRRPSQRKYFS